MLMNPVGLATASQICWPGQSCPMTIGSSPSAADRAFGDGRTPHSAGVTATRGPRVPIRQAPLTRMSAHIEIHQDPAYSELAGGFQPARRTGTPSRIAGGIRAGAPASTRNSLGCSVVVAPLGLSIASGTRRVSGGVCCSVAGVLSALALTRCSPVQ
jgi:hypothetical protein